MMMMFEEMGFCGDLDFFPAPLKEVEVEVEVAAPHTEPVVEDDYSDEDIDVDELEKRMWRDKMKLKRLKEMNQGKEDVHSAKRWLLSTQERAHDRFIPNRIDTCTPPSIKKKIFFIKNIS